jgi:hypothetical protein
MGGGFGCNPWDGLTSATQALSAQDVSSWSDAQVRDGLHHLLAWYVGGATNTDNLLLLRRSHHGLVHDGLPAERRWQICLDPTTGEVTVCRPRRQALRTRAQPTVPAGYPRPSTPQARPGLSATSHRFARTV